MPSKPWLGGVKAFIIRNRVEIIAALGIIAALIAGAVIIVLSPYGMHRLFGV